MIFSNLERSLLKNQRDPFVLAENNKASKSQKLDLHVENQNKYSDVLMAGVIGSEMYE